MAGGVPDTVGTVSWRRGTGNVGVNVGVMGRCDARPLAVIGSVPGAGTLWVVNIEWLFSRMCETILR